MARTSVPLQQVSAELNQLGQTSQVVHSEIITMLATVNLPESSLPSLYAARRAAQSLVLHLDTVLQLVESEK